jgi:deoxyribose-phosphate aldolase
MTRMFFNVEDLAARIDQTRLSPDTTLEDLHRTCDEARRYGFAAVCIPPCYVEEATRWLQGEPVAVGTVIGFPLGYQFLSVKIVEALEAVKHGASELDLMIHLGAVKMGNADAVRTELMSLRSVVEGTLLRVIIETCYLTREEKISVCRWARDAGLVWVKTSTGFGPKGATTSDVRLLKNTMGQAGHVKAAGGIRDLKTAAAMVRAGASRIGTSRGVEIVREYLRERGRS